MVTEGDGDARRRRGRLVVAGAALAAVAGAGAVAVATRGGPPPAPRVTGIPVATTTVVKTDLSDTVTLPGTLGFGAARPLRGAGTGLVTRLPKPGATTVRGRPLYWADDRPVAVFYGDTPLFRRLGALGARGRDVAVVADNLRALGYAPGSAPVRSWSPAPQGTPAPPGEVFTASLRAALKRWQQDNGLKPTGVLDVGQAVVFPGPMRVDAVKAQLGDPVAGEILSVTRTAQVVTVPVETASAGTIRRGAKVRIVLPDGRTAGGTVTAVARTAQDAADSSGQSQTRLDVTVTPAKRIKGLDAAPVEVRFTSALRRGVLAVPIGALLALREGGYALQTPGGTLVAARTGMFARGMVEVGGPGIAAGLKVVTSS
ncbi:peptidoglycan-binding protein [Microbispora corallina]|uniref:Peptidoglycan-binding protein n=1 Tax=Microbispora corallina TaxID=83302 RepID=A0ABQ4G9D1_9ACTN|nr:peptidoglycan-binding domain-containing protein [Microbispora corallina]GIH43667.1 peptidoglycan-binding protein [Microbispora corallina]